jgi:hypothetical protein
MGSLLMVFAVQRLPGAERIEVPPPSIPEQVSTVKKDMERVRTVTTDRIVASTEPVPVVTERVRPDPSPAVPPLVALPRDAEGENGPEPKYKHRTRERHTSRGGDVCSRHGQRKVMVGRYKWRCRR